MIKKIKFDKHGAAAFLAIREERLNKICADYRRFIRTECDAVGGEQPMSRLLGKSPNYVRESLNGGVVSLKRCAEAIAEIVGEGK